jgi:hypothetical protein
MGWTVRQVNEAIAALELKSELEGINGATDDDSL